MYKPGRISLGVMQGRLCDKPGRPLQSFPDHAWREEFQRAAMLGFDAIEWVLDGINDTHNPVATSKGRNEMLKLCGQYGVRVSSLCAHKFIDGSLLERGAQSQRSRDHLWRVLDWAWAAEIEFVILPVMEKMSLANQCAYEIFLSIFQNKLEGNGPILLLESDLPANKLKTLIGDMDATRLGIVYDLGNATALGFDINNDLNLLHKFIYEIHIKDRLYLDGVSVRLGEGDTPFSSASQSLTKLNWSGQVVLETPIFYDWRGEALHNIQFAKKWLKGMGRGV